MSHTERPGDNWSHTMVSCGTPRKYTPTCTHTQGHYGKGKMSHTMSSQKQWHSDNDRTFKHTGSPRVTHTCHHQSETHRVTHRVNWLRHTGVHTYTNTLSPDLLMKEAQSSRGYGTKIVYYKRNPTKMPNNLHRYQCPARAHLPLVMDLGRGEQLFPGSTSSGRGEGSGHLGGGPGRRLVPENNRGKTSGQGMRWGEYLF